jgi:UDP-glucose 4-epimerase
VTIAWVIGSGGLLGSALTRELQRGGGALFFPAVRLCWDSESMLAAQIETAVAEFAARAADGLWEIYWAAGVGNMGSVAADLARETRTLELLLELVGNEPRLSPANGALAFASSAGAIYAGSVDYIINEHTLPAPTTPYAREKLKQEERVRSFASARPGFFALIGRISTLYGPGQAQGKRQGLIAHIARCVIRNEPIQIFVPFDTIRDYIAADDVAARIVAGLRASNREPECRVSIVAAEQPTTIAEIVATFKKIARRVPRIVTSASRLTSVYSRRVQFRSVEGAGPGRSSSTSLIVGIAQVMAAERAAYVRSAGGIFTIRNHERAPDDNP